MKTALWIVHGQGASEAPDVRRTGHPVDTGHPVMKKALWIVAGQVTPEAPDIRRTGHPVATGHPASVRVQDNRRCELDFV